MAVLVDKDTKVICRGLSGSQGTFHAEQAIACGTQMVRGVTPGQIVCRDNGQPAIAQKIAAQVRSAA